MPELDYYTELFVYTDMSYDELHDYCLELTGAIKDVGGIFTTTMELAVIKNKLRDKEQAIKSNCTPCYPYFLEVDPLENADIEAFMNELCHLIITLRKSGIPTVASCDFEDIIAEKTGWNWRSDNQWPPEHLGPHFKKPKKS